MPADRLPAVYLSHGAPLLADDPVWPGQLAALAADIPGPKAILKVSSTTSTDSPRRFDVVLLNERGEVTGTCTAALAVLLDGTWWTPALASDRLPGVERARLVATGVVRERILWPEDPRIPRHVLALSSACLDVAVSHPVDAHGRVGRGC